MVQLSSRGRRKRLPRHGTSPGGKQRSECDVCKKILSLLSSMPDGVDFFELGNFKDVMISTKCTIHPRMFKSYFDADLENAHITKFGAMNFGGRNPGIFLEAHIAHSSRLLLSRKLYLVSRFNVMESTSLGKIVNPHWIERNIIRQWKRGCDGRNNKDCHTCPAACRLPSARPSRLIDTWRLCLTPGTVNVSYVALSYVWGKGSFFKTTRKDLPQLQLDQALFDSHNRLGIPRTIEDAIKLLDILEERYLWVDSLCIVQDDDEEMHDQINNMALIFANATITIIAKQGSDADYGLRGLRGISEPRHFSQDVFTLDRGYSITTTHRQEDQSPWSQRGWTFQEQIFSRRQLVFCADRVHWKCACGSFFEDLKPSPGSEIVSHSVQGRDKIFSTSFPDMFGYATLVQEYNDRLFSYPEDALAAFSGITSALSHTFLGGFICGLPALFLDMALVWQPSGTCERRIPSIPSNPTEMGLPSWSWVGWRGKIDKWSWNCRFEYFRLDTREQLNLPRTIPLVQWYSRSFNNTDLAAIQEPSELEGLRRRGPEGGESLPTGWRRFEDNSVVREPGIRQTRYFYKHDSDPLTEFWHPIPLCESSHSLPRLRGTDTLLCCRTQRSRAFLSQELSRHAHLHPTISIRNSQGIWIGKLRPHNNKLLSEDNPSEPPNSEMTNSCQLVAISQGYFYEKWTYSMFAVDEWDHAERPRTSEKYEFYNVLWVEWQDGIAYRKACGRIMKSAWECQELEWIDLVLG